MDKQPLGITDVVLRDAHQSLLATRMRLDDMLPIAAKLDESDIKPVAQYFAAQSPAPAKGLDHE